ncbi:MAG: FMN-binding protein [Peptococcaceae bacterium]|jgi:electron transport complex protein RnfG|nr:FMN-binding protein [Peptococcaceae bacterium]
MEHAEHNSHNETSALKIALNLVCATLISGLILGVIYAATHKIAEQKQVELKQASMISLVQADEFKEIEGQAEWYEALKDGQLVAYILPAEGKGYGGTIAILVAISPEMTVLKYTITEAAETPGLGAKAAEPLFSDQFIGKDTEHLVVTKDPSQKDLIQSISGSTITSRAVTNAIKESVEQLSAFVQEGGK